LDWGRQEFPRLLADPIKSLFFEKIEKGELDEEVNRKFFEFFTKEI
jgi:hypothetical protein